MSPAARGHHAAIRERRQRERAQAQELLRRAAPDRARLRQPVPVAPAVAPEAGAPIGGVPEVVPPGAEHPSGAPRHPRPRRRYQDMSPPARRRRSAAEEDPYEGSDASTIPYREAGLDLDLEEFEDVPARAEPPRRFRAFRDASPARPAAELRRSSRAPVPRVRSTAFGGLPTGKGWSPEQHGLVGCGFLSSGGFY
jgi:hypothetical protein